MAIEIIPVEHAGIVALARSTALRLRRQLSLLRGTWEPASSPSTGGSPPPAPDMCGRFALSMLPRSSSKPSPATRQGLGESWNVTPDRQIPIVHTREDGIREAGFARWGLLGPWMKEAERFRPPDQCEGRDCCGEAHAPRQLQEGPLPDPGHRLLRMAEGRHLPPRPFFVGLGSGQPSLPGLWRRNRLADGTLLDTCAVLTTSASPLLHPIHHRMPVILPEANQPLWLDPALKDADSRGPAHPRPRPRAHRLGIGRAVNIPNAAAAGRADGSDAGRAAAGEPALRAIGTDATAGSAVGCENSARLISAADTPEPQLVTTRLAHVDAGIREHPAQLGSGLQRAVACTSPA